MLSKVTIKDFLEGLEAVDPVDVEDFARELITQDFAPCFGDLALARLPDIPDGPLSPENARRLGELEEQLEAEWWEQTGNALLAELLAKARVVI